MTAAMGTCSKFSEILLGLRLPDDLLKQIDVLGKGGAADGCQGACGERSVLLETLCDRKIARLLQGADVGGDIAIRHPQRIPHLREGKLRIRRQHGHDSKPSLFMDNPIQL